MSNVGRVGPILQGKSSSLRQRQIMAAPSEPPSVINNIVCRQKAGKVILVAFKPLPMTSRFLRNGPKEIDAPAGSEQYTSECNDTADR